MKFKVNDSVKVILGKDKGRVGKIEKILPREGKALVEGVNLYKKHVKAFGSVKAGIYDVPRPISLSKLALICPECKKTTRVGFRLIGDKKVRVCKKCTKEISSN